MLLSASIGNDSLGLDSSSSSESSSLSDCVARSSCASGVCGCDGLAFAARTDRAFSLGCYVAML